MSHGRRIGRIKFIEPTPAVKERYFYRWNSKDLHFNPDVFPQLSGEGLFNSPSPINLEIGCGTGEYITGLAKSHPKENYVGIETSTRSVYFAIDLARKNRLENIRFIHGDFKLTYPLIPDNSIKTLILHFPDPNYGSKHIKHRIFDQNFLNKMNTAIISTGLISVVTDQKEFFFDMLEIAENDHRFTKTHTERFLDHYQSDVKSRFQLAWERINRPIYRFELTKS